MFHLQEYQGAQCYLIEDEFNVRFYRIGLSEYHLISQLNGSTSLSEAVAVSSAELGDAALGEQEAVNIYKWLVDNGLATTEASRSSGRVMESLEKSDSRKRQAQLNPITPKIPIGNPDAWLTQINRWTTWIFSFPAALIWVGVVAAGIYAVTTHWDELLSSQTLFFAPNNWLWFGLTWITLKVIHELAHGLACKRFHGEIRQCGIMLILLIPLPFIDVTSSWRFSSKWRRMMVAAAGMYVEIFVAGIAALVWASADPGVLKQQMFNILLAGSLTTLLFNANPLMRFDGYYILSDFLELPNLGTHGQQWLRWLGKKYYLGLSEDSPNWPEGRRWLIASYAVLAFIWKILICVSLVILAESLLFGAGVGLAIIAMLYWVIWPGIQLVKLVFIGEETKQRPSRVRFLALTGILATTGWFMCTQVPWYARVKAHAIVDFQEKLELRTRVGGFVKELHVRSGERVRQGQVIASLENPQLRSELEKLSLEIEASQLKIRALRNNEELSARDVELKNLKSLQEKFNLESQRKNELVVLAPIDGLILYDDQENPTGTYIVPGHRICQIAPERHKELRALVSQHDLELFKQRIGTDVDVHVWGTGTGYVSARLVHLDPRGRIDLPHPAFSAMAGGPLAVRLLPQDPNSTQPEALPVALVSPHFLAKVRLPGELSEELLTGQPASVSFRTSRGSIGDVLSEKITLWIRTLRKNSRQLNQFSQR